MTKDEELKEIRAARYGWWMVFLFSLSTSVTALVVQGPESGEFWFFLLVFLTSIFMQVILYRHKQWVNDDNTDLSIFD